MLRLTSPAVVLFDDIDRLGEQDLGSLLSLIENLNKEIGKNAIIMASVNDICALPEALTRPGRFDEIKLFNYPTAEMRKEILQGYLEHFGTRLANKFVDEVVELSKDLTPAYLREIALQITIKPFDQIPDLIKHIKKMVGYRREEDIDEEMGDEEIDSIEDSIFRSE
jgi:SpoVK/Ycf46/Vps4 family AAA+-type ATPase